MTRHNTTMSELFSSSCHGDQSVSRMSRWWAPFSKLRVKRANATRSIR